MRSGVCPTRKVFYHMDSKWCWVTWSLSHQRSIYLTGRSSLSYTINDCALWFLPKHPKNEKYLITDNTQHFVLWDTTSSMYNMYFPYLGLLHLRPPIDYKSYTHHSNDVILCGGSLTILQSSRRTGASLSNEISDLHSERSNERKDSTKLLTPNEKHKIMGKLSKAGR